MRHAKENEKQEWGEGWLTIVEVLSSLLSAQLIGEIVPRLQHEVAIRRSRSGDRSYRIRLVDFYECTESCTRVS